MSKRLPDFKQSKLFMSLREKMGADDSFELPSLYIGQISLSEIRQLKTSSINIENIYKDDSLIHKSDNFWEICTWNNYYVWNEDHKKIINNVRRRRIL